MTPSTEAFRRLHQAEQPLFLPNAWDYASAAALAGRGYAALGTTSLGVAAAAGRPDAAGETRAETVALARAIAGLCLVTVDLEGGFSEDPEEVAELAAGLAAAGVAGINLEDGRADGSLAPPEHQQALVAAVKRRAPELFVNARTDTYWLGGEHATVTETLRRAGAYLEAGADGIFVPAAADDALIAELVHAIPAPLNILFLPAHHRLDRLAALGVRRVSCGSLLFRAALYATVAWADAIRDGEPPPPGKLPSYGAVQGLVREGAAG
jgi:2-methylisocitrate lyase-like PEP mutase family enzyme